MGERSDGHLALEVPSEVRQIRVVRILTANAIRSLTNQDETRVQRLLIAISEVFNNAVKTTSRATGADPIRFRLDIFGDRVRVSITDSGGGFGEHQRTDTAGLGKGLVIAEAFSDSIEVASAQGTTTVTLVLDAP